MMKLHLSQFVAMAVVWFAVYVIWRAAVTLCSWIAYLGGFST